MSVTWNHKHPNINDVAIGTSGTLDLTSASEQSFDSHLGASHVSVQVDYTNFTGTSVLKIYYRNNASAGWVDSGATVTLTASSGSTILQVDDFCSDEVKLTWTAATTGTATAYFIAR